MRLRPVPALAGLLLASASLTALADGQVIDKIYQPYVEPLEREVELRMTSATAVQGHAEQWRLGYGQALGERLFVEGYVIGERSGVEKTLELEAQEVEARWQLTEAGEQAVDWGLMVEIEHENKPRAWEYAGTLIGSRSWGRWSGTANLTLAYETGRGIDSEFETAAGLQWKYRLGPRLEPALEVWLGENTRALGPVLMGTERLGQRRKLHWELGLIFALDEQTPDRTLRGLLEYEF